MEKQDYGRKSKMRGLLHNLNVGTDHPAVISTAVSPHVPGARNNPTYWIVFVRLCTERKSLAQEAA